MEQKYAGFGIRLIASLIDAVIVGLGNTAVSYMFQAIMGERGAFLGLPLGLVIGFIYYVWYQHKETQTIGKRVMKIKVITNDGKTPSMFTFFLREQVGKMVSAILFLIGYFMVLWDPKKQALHDKIANTYVVYVPDSIVQSGASISGQNTPPPVPSSVSTPSQNSQSTSVPSASTTQVVSSQTPVTPQA